MSTLRLSNISNADGSATTSANNVINGSAKAWVNFNGTGTVAIRRSYNVSSIVDLGVGQYAVSMTTAMPNTSYAVIGTAADAINNFPFVGALPLTTSQANIGLYTGAAFTDFSVVQVAIFS